MSGAAIAVGAAVSAVGSIYSASRQSSAQKRAADAQERASANALKEQQMQFNKENQKEVDVSGILENNVANGNSSSMITGPGGVNRNDLPLGGGSSLLGG